MTTQHPDLQIVVQGAFGTLDMIYEDQNTPEALRAFIRQSHTQRVSEFLAQLDEVDVPAETSPRPAVLPPTKPGRTKPKANPVLRRRRRAIVAREAIMAKATASKAQTTKTSTNDQTWRAEDVADFLHIPKKRVQELAHQGLIPVKAVRGNKRKFYSFSKEAICVLLPTRARSFLNAQEVAALLLQKKKVRKSVRTINQNLARQGVTSILPKGWGCSPVYLKSDVERVLSKI